MSYISNATSLFLTIPFCPLLFQRSYGDNGTTTREMRCTLGKNLRTSRYAVASHGSRGRGRDIRRSATTATATPSAVRATTATARERAAALAIASVNGTLVRQGCSWLAIALFHRRHYPRLLVSDDAVVALATIPRRDDLATVLAHHRDQPEVCALSTDGQLTPAATGTPVQPQLAIPAGAGDSAIAASSFLLPLSVIAEPTPTSEPELSRHVFISPGTRMERIYAYVLSSSIIA